MSGVRMRKTLYKRGNIPVSSSNSSHELGDTSIQKLYQSAKVNTAQPSYLL